MTKITLKTTIRIMAATTALSLGLIIAGCDLFKEEETERQPDPTEIIITDIPAEKNNKKILLWIFPEERAGNDMIANIAMAEGIVSNGRFSGNCVKQGDLQNWHETGKYCILINFSFGEPG